MKTTYIRNGVECLKGCPLLTKTVVVHNKRDDHRTIPLGVNLVGDNEVGVTHMRPCIQEECIFYDEITNMCMYAASIAAQAGFPQGPNPFRR